MTSDPGRWRRWLRRGPSRADLAAEAELWRQRCERNNAEKHEAYARAKAAERDLRVAQARLREVVALVLIEPELVDGCRRVRFHRRGEAEDWGAAIGTDSGEGADAYGAYQCKACPLSPVTMKRYWHAGHRLGRQGKAAYKARQRQRSQQRTSARRDGRLLEQLVGRDVADRLRQMNNQEDGQT